MLTAEEKKTLLLLGRKTLESLEDGDPRATYEEFLNLSSPLSEGLSRAVPCFVTLKTRGGRVRGSTGTTASHRPLMETVHFLTLEAALRDPRFAPLAAQDVSQVIVQISVLSPFEPLVNWQTLNLKEHGLFLRRGKAQSVLLNQYAQEQRWTQAEPAVRYLTREAGIAEGEASSAEWFYFSEFSFQEAFR